MTGFDRGGGGMGWLLKPGADFNINAAIYISLNTIRAETGLSYDILISCFM